MNALEAFAVNIVLGILQSVIKNPAHKAAVKNQLTGLAQDILAAYAAETANQ